MIKNIFNTGSYPKNVDVAVFVLRVVVGIFMLTHGWGKFLLLTGTDPIQFPDPLGVGVTTSLVLTVFAEVFCSVLLIAGLTTKLAAFASLITMFVAAFVVHANDGFGKQELALLYAVIYLVIAVIGAGKISLYHFIHQKITSK